MMPACFNVSVYQMESNQQVKELADSSIMDTAFAQDDERNFDSGFVEETVVENLLPLSVTQMDVKAMQALEHTDLCYTPDNDNDADENVSSKQVVSYVPIVNESSERIELVFTVFLFQKNHC